MRTLETNIRKKERKKKPEGKKEWVYEDSKYIQIKRFSNEKKRKTTEI